MINVKYSNLGKSKVWGFAHFDTNTIELDKRLKGRKELEIIIHEAIHLIQPDKTEAAVVSISTELTRLLWALNYRKMDNDATQPLQDEIK